MDLLLSLDPTVQVALLGIVGTVIAGAWALIKISLAPKEQEKEKEYGPKPIVHTLAEVDHSKLDKAINTVDNLNDTIERLRVEMSRR